MPKFVFKDPLVISGSSGVSSTLVGETQAYGTEPIEISIAISGLTFSFTLLSTIKISAFAK